VPSGYDILVEDRYLHVIYRGDQDFATTNQAIREAAQRARDSGAHALLFNISRSNRDGYISEVVRHAEMARELGLNGFRIAFYGPPEKLDAVAFMETVARNRGFNARGFTDIDEAVKWLLA
jgi:hypothetical protein